MSGARQDDEFSRDLMEDFFLDFREAHQSCENTLIDLEHDPANTELLNTLFRSVHTIKGNLVYVGLKDLTPLIQSVEDVLDAVRKHSLTYDASLSDVIMLAMDKTKQMVEARMAQQPLPLDELALNQLCQQISRVAEVSLTDRPAVVRAVLAQMDPTILIEPVAAPRPEQPAPLALQPEENEILQRFGIPLGDDIRFLQHLIQPLEERSHYWKGRNARLLQLALAMNRHAGEPVEPDQLAVAVFLHDLGMAFLPISILHKTGALSAADLEAVRQHPLVATQLIASLKHWEQAGLIVKEHHEREDGQGYPAGLKGAAICPGAKILAIADTFDACTHERAYSAAIKRPLVRAVLEINRCSGSHFDAEWVEVFNEVARRLQNQA
ncbi:MAG TPA: HD domain-containing phosphohydrolase [Candidatus Kapabacteria bacterium]|nr:HD domain-containing phosphohydrolase [Candidatus Kapabacteria bacterium]